MIVRILHEGQYEVTGEALLKLKGYDDEMLKELSEEDEVGFREAFNQLLKLVRSGRKLPYEELRESDLIIPGSDFSLGEIHKFFSGDMA